MSNIDKYYQSRRYQSSTKEDFETLAREKAQLFFKILQGQRFEKALDAGCGDGKLAQIMGEKLGVSFYGVDISKKGIELAKKIGVKAKVADLSLKIPFKDNFFDLVISTEVLEHVNDPDIFLREIYRVLKPNGKLLLTTPNLSSWLNRVLFVLGIYPIFLEASTEAKVGYGIFSKFFNSKDLVGHIHVFNYGALIDTLKFHKYSIEKVVGNTKEFKAPSAKVITAIYYFIDKIMSKFPSLSSDLVVLARK